MIDFKKGLLLLFMLISWAFSTQAALEVTLESFKITAGEKDQFGNLSGEYRLSVAKKGDEWQTHCFDHWIEFYPNDNAEGWVGYQAKKPSGCKPPKVVYGQSLRLGQEFLLNRDFYQKSRTHFYQYSCQKDPPGVMPNDWAKWRNVLSNQIDMLVYNECRGPYNYYKGEPTPYIDAKPGNSQKTVSLYSPIQVTENEVVQLCFFEMDFSAYNKENKAYFRITPFFPNNPTKINPIYTYATHDYYKQFGTNEWSTKPKDLVESCFELSAKTLWQKADNNNRVELNLTNEKLRNKEEAALTLTVKPALPNNIASLTDAFSEQLSDRRNTEQFLNNKNDWALSYDLDNPSDTDKAGSKILNFPFTTATKIVLHSHLLTGNQWVLPNQQLIGFIKDWIWSKDTNAYLVFKQNQKILGIRPLASSEAVSDSYQNLLSGYDVQIQSQPQTGPFSANTLDLITQGWLLNKDNQATIWLRKHNQLVAAFALADLSPKMANAPEKISNAKIYFSQNPPNGIENGWAIKKTRFFEATLEWLKTQDNNAWLTFEDIKGNQFMNTLPVNFNQKNWPAQQLTVNIRTGLDFQTLKKLATVKISRGLFSQEYSLSETIKLPRGDYQLNDFTIDVVYNKPWVTHLLNDRISGQTITIDSKTTLPKLTITSPDSAISDADWKKYCHLEQPQDAKRLFKVLTDGQAPVNCYPLLVKNAVAQVDFRETDQSIHFNLHGIRYVEVKLKMNRSDLADWYLTDGKTPVSFTDIFINGETRIIDLMSRYHKSAQEVLETTWYLTKEEVAQRYELKFSLKDTREHYFNNITPTPFFKTALLPNTVWSELLFEVTKGNQVWTNCQINSEKEFLCDGQTSLMLTDFIGATLKIQGLPGYRRTLSSNEQEAKIPLTAIRCGQWSKIFPLNDDNRWFFQKNAACDSFKINSWSLKITQTAESLSDNLCTLALSRETAATPELKSQAVTAADPNMAQSKDAFCQSDDDGCHQQSHKKWLHMLFINSDGNWRKYYLARGRKPFIQSWQADFPKDIGLYIWFLSQQNRDKPSKLIPFQRALKKEKDFRNYQQAYDHLIRLPRLPGDSRPIDDQITRSLNLLKQQINNNDELTICDQHAVIVFTNQLNVNTASSQIADYLPNLHRLIVLAGNEVDQTRLDALSQQSKVTFIPLDQNRQWRDTLIQQIKSLW
jgi:hypothetical protein